MAVTLKGDGYALLPLFGVSTNLIEKAKACGVTVEQPFPGSFYVKYNGMTFGSISVKGQAITLAKSGSLGPASKEALNSQFTQALNGALASYAVGHGHSGPAVVGHGHSMSTVVKTLDATLGFDPGAGDETVASKPKAKKIPLAGKSSKVTSLEPGDIGEEGDDELEAEAPKSFHNSQLDWDEDPVKVMTSGSIMPLSKASKLYQPVYGTSGGSVYITVALFKGAQMAARVTNGKMSLRMEGPDIKTYQTSLADLGFGFKEKDGYASVHYDISDESLLLKTFGAILGRIGLARVKSCADIMVTKGYGK